MTDKLTPLPDWIQVVVHSKTWKLVKYKASKLLKPLCCTNCKYKWFPRIKNDGTIIIPGTCPSCRTKAWRKIR